MILGELNNLNFKGLFFLGCGIDKRQSIDGQ
jgi:hypothetical protein